MRRAALWVLLVAILAYTGVHFWPEKVIDREIGILCPDEPLQSKPSRGTPWLHGDFMITALADYDISAVVLSRRNYGSGTESAISPVDIALGWGPMSDAFVIDKFNITQGHRWYKWKPKGLMPMPQRDVERNSANVHIIPANDDVTLALRRVYKGSIVHMRGHLVKVTKTDGWRWISSLTRNDTGDGACEVFWVEDLSVEN